MQTKTTGQLKKIDSGKISGHVYEFFQCVDCGTEYPVIEEYDVMKDSFEKHIKCNGHVINKCPWCREDSRPWTNGRGL